MRAVGKPEWVDKVAELVVRFDEVGNPDDGDLRRDFVPAMQSLPDHGNAIGRGIVERLLAAGRNVRHLYHAIPALVGPDDARWLVAQSASEDLVKKRAHIRASGNEGCAAKPDNAAAPRGTRPMAA